MTTATMNGPAGNTGTKKSLSAQIDRLDSIISGLAEALPEAVADAVKGAVGLAVQEAVRGVLSEVLTNPEVLAKLRAAVAPASPQSTTQPAPQPQSTTFKAPTFWAQVKATISWAGSCIKAATKATAKFLGDLVGRAASTIKAVIGWCIPAWVKNRATVGKASVLWAAIKLIAKVAAKATWRFKYQVALAIGIGGLVGWTISLLSTGATHWLAVAMVAWHVSSMVSYALLWTKRQTIADMLVCEINGADYTDSNGYPGLWSGAWASDAQQAQTN